MSSNAMVPCVQCGKVRQVSYQRLATAATMPCRECARKDAPHGTVARYRRKCRCAECREAARLYAQKYRRSDKGSKAARKSASRNNFIRQEALAWVRQNHPEVIIELEGRWNKKLDNSTVGQ